MTTNTAMTNPAATAPVQRVSYSRLWWVGLLAIALSIAVNLLVRAVALPFITVPPEFMPLSTAMPVVFFTAIGALAAIIVFAIVGRFSRQPARTYTIIAIVVLVLSLIPNAMMLGPAAEALPGANLGNVIVLMVMHVTTAAVVVWLLTTQAVETSPARR